MGHRIAVLRTGVLQQVAPPQDLYDRPANAFVAGFVGSPGMNLVPGSLAAGDTVAAGEDDVAVDLPGGRIVLAGEAAMLARKAPALTVGVRPEHVALATDGPLEGRVALVELLGADVQVVCELPGGCQVVVRQEARRRRPRLGEPVRLTVDVGAVHLFDAETGRRLALAS